VDYEGVFFWGDGFSHSNNVADFDGALEFVFLDVAQFGGRQQQISFLFDQESVVLMHFSRKNNSFILLQLRHDHLVLPQIQVILANWQDSDVFRSML